MLYLNGESMRLVNNACFPSTVAPSYAPAGQACQQTRCACVCLIAIWKGRLHHSRVQRDGKRRPVCTHGQVRRLFVKAHQFTSLSLCDGELWVNTKARRAGAGVPVYNWHAAQYVRR